MSGVWQTRPRVCCAKELNGGARSPSSANGIMRTRNENARLAPETTRHFLRFTVVGALGIAVQLGVLELLRLGGTGYLLATVIAVEAAVLHNFLWHQRYTWRDRGLVTSGESLTRLVRFHLTNGAVSLVGNVLAMRLLVGEVRLPVVPANLIAITACWFLNFALSDRLVFTPCGHLTCRSPISDHRPPDSEPEQIGNLHKELAIVVDE